MHSGALREWVLGGTRPAPLPEAARSAQESPVAVEVDHLSMQYGSFVAVRDLSFRVTRGEIFGLIGPNGAGKTTTIECVQGQRRPTGGTVRVLGLDPLRQRAAIKERVGAQLQNASLFPRMKVWEAADLFASFYRSAVDWNPLLRQMGLAEKRDEYFGQLSGGERQRLFVVLALLNQPELLFLDELTTGLDPQGRRAIWGVLRDLRQQGKTIFLTTHFMEEAEQLCDRVAVMSEGRVLVMDTPQALIARLAVDRRLLVQVEGEFDTRALTKLDFVTGVIRRGDEVIVAGGEGMVRAVLDALQAQNCNYRNLRTEQPGLEDLVLALTAGSARG